MKWIHVWIIFFTCLIESDCKYMSLLNQLDMKNPVIVGRNDDLKNVELFNLMKDLMKHNQSICITTRFGNDTLQNSPGIIFRSYKDRITDLYGQESSANIQNPWIILGEIGV